VPNYSARNALRGAGARGSSAYLVLSVARSARNSGRWEFPGGPAMDTASKCPVSGKRKYATEGAALATAKHQVATANAPMELRAYRCNWCKAWHLTKKTEKTGRDHG
jgi:hypothetical protein